ncbi:hypothetical protein PV733_46985 [Streptomyces europaeiscabiei]|uniref:hypothetical protein n=1 Tax=Streptomyces europaeiscabiei TaxID=146819 RepID=UPI0029ABEFD8|nr:hypothetical protein [Streptomyces europaeiscabiei]MDX3716297.1 hypothetical protein [Streptomyces europaeiscabiei]
MAAGVAAFPQQLWLGAFGEAVVLVELELEAAPVAFERTLHARHGVPAVHDGADDVLGELGVGAVDHCHIEVGRL